MTNTSNLGVQVTYRDRKLDPVCTKTYGLEEYTKLLERDLMSLISDVETLCYKLNDGNSKEEWNDDTFTSFQSIKHKLLDKAGDIGRLPQNLVTLPERG